MIIAYIATHRETGRKYVGITSTTLHKRWLQHCGYARRGHGTYLAHAIAKYGPDAFVVEQVGVATTREEAAALERRLIAEHKTMHPCGFNLTSGGEKNVGFSLNETVREKQRRGRLGKKHSAEAKALISAARTGTKWSDEARAKMSNTRKCPWTDEQRRVLGAAMRTPEYREKMRQAQLRRWAKVREAA